MVDKIVIKEEGDKNDKTERVVVTERDIEAANGPILSCIDIEENIWVRFGFPIIEKEYWKDIYSLSNLRGVPYVFTADEIVLRDKEHPTGVFLENKTVIFMHGGRNDKGEWVFNPYSKEEQSIKKTVKKVDDYLLKNGKEKISIVLACDSSEGQSLDLSIKVDQFPTNNPKIHVFEEVVSINRFFMREDGTTVVELSAEKFRQLEQLALFDSIKIKPIE